MTNRGIVAGIAFSQSRISISPHTKTISKDKAKRISRLQKCKVQLDFCEVVVGNLTSQSALKNPISIPERIAKSKF